MKQDTERKITVEDLIRLKRAERPPAEFWATFEAEIRSKQLSAIVNRRPWWHGLARASAIVSRYQLPFGAAAAVALTWTGVHYYSASPSRVIPVAAVRSEAKVVVSAPVAAAQMAAAPVVERTVRTRVETEVGIQEAAPVHEAVVTATASHLSKAPSDIPYDAIAKSPFGDGIAVSLADYREPATDTSRRSVFGTDRDFEPSIAVGRQAPSDPLARMDPAEERRSRLLAPALPAYASGSRSSLAGDWMKARASSDERMYESMDRGSSDRMLVGFRF